MDTTPISVLEQYRGDRHVMEYFGPWSIMEDRFRSAVDQVAGTNLRLHIEHHQQDVQAVDRTTRTFEVTRSGVAIIELTGPLMKFGSSFSDGGSTVRARREIRSAVNDEDVAAIVLKIDSPGGTVSGTFDLVDDVREAASRKPVHAFIEDLGASAAYAIASAATKVYANRTALVGSIGTFAVILDASTRAEQLGVKVHVVRAGEFKGAGTLGTEVTEEQLANFQRTVNDLNAEFLAAVQTGRNMAIDKVRELADGRVHIATEAMRLGLIDGIQTFDETLRQLAAAPQSTRRSQMSENTNVQAVDAVVATLQPAAATIEQIRATCQGAEDKFVLQQLEAKATIEQVQERWTAHQAEIIAKQKQELEEKEKALEAEKAKADLGVDPLADGNPNKGSEAGGELGDARAEWSEKVEALVSKGTDRQKAVLLVNKRNPGLRQRMIEEANPTA